MTDQPQPLILASSSPFRRELLAKLRLSFQHHSPDIDESARPGETPTELVLRLARDKAAALAEAHPDALIIGSDQVAVIDGEVLGKPGDHDTAVAQLRHASGRTVQFLTGLCQIERYIELEQPFKCAGSFKSEGLGIVLFKALEGRDPNALVGLPLIMLTDFLAAEGVALP